MNKVLERAVEAYGEKQLVKAVEELSELQKELCKLINNDENYCYTKIAEEIADVEIMLEQTKMICESDFDSGYKNLIASNFRNLIAEYKKMKIERLKESLESEVSA